MATKRETTRTGRSTSSSSSVTCRAAGRSTAASPTCPGSATRSTTPSTAKATSKVNTADQGPEHPQARRGHAQARADRLDRHLHLARRRCATGAYQPRTVTIVLLDEARNAVLSLVLKNAQPKKWVGPTLAAKGGGEVAMEELHLVHEGIDYQ